MSTPKSEITKQILQVLEADLWDETGVIKRGPLQANPVKLEHSLLLREMDPFEVSDSWRDVRYSQMSDHERTYAFNIADEIGGSKAWMLRGVIELNLNYTRKKLLRDPAFELADELRFKIQSNISNAHIAFGCEIGKTYWTIFDLEITDVRTIESGGPKAWNWRYALYYQAPALETPLI